MKSKEMKFLLLIGVTGLSLLSMSIQKYVLDTGFDEAGLLIMANPVLWLVWIVTIAYLAGVAVLTRYLGDNGTYSDNFSACFFSGIASVLAGLMMGFSGLNGLVPGQMVTALCAIGAGCAMAICGVCRISGRKPVWWLDFMVFGHYTVYLVLSYRLWNFNPQLQLFAFQVLACAALVLFSLHRARCAVDVMDRRRMVFFGFAGLYLCFLAMPGAQAPGFYFASALWCAGGMCELVYLEKPRAVPELPEDSENPQA